MILQCFGELFCFLCIVLKIKADYFYHRVTQSFSQRFTENENKKNNHRLKRCRKSVLIFLICG